MRSFSVSFWVFFLFESGMSMHSKCSFSWLRITHIRRTRSRERENNNNFNNNNNYGLWLSNNQHAAGRWQPVRRTLTTLSCNYIYNSSQLFIFNFKTTLRAEPTVIWYDRCALRTHEYKHVEILRPFTCGNEVFCNLWIAVSASKMLHNAPSVHGRSRRTASTSFSYRCSASS